MEEGSGEERFTKGPQMWCQALAVFHDPNLSDGS